MEISKEIENTFVNRMPQDLKQKLLALSDGERVAIIRVLVRFQQVVEEETFQLLSGILETQLKKK